jgi:hypothetical protein
VLRVTERICSCGRWQEFGYPCQDEMVYFWVIEKKTLFDVMDSDAISDFYKYHFYHELLFWIIWKQQMK